ncbi:B3 domain-containing transcription factor VAL3-like [Arachis hypogaea]|uniref:B3 domain-containing transcription factor VAL3-like n=1 Tax=Arachis hypogaea TaxID=3818 RepID=UPI0007AF0C4B
MTPMFKKVLSATDTKVKSGRLVIPTKGARAYLPELEDKQRCILLEILDTKGNIWKLSYRFWENNRGRIYVLGGLKAYITIWKWQVGDQDCVLVDLEFNWAVWNKMRVIRLEKLTFGSLELVKGEVFEVFRA